MIKCLNLLGALALACCAAACGRAAPQLDAAYEQEILDWRAGRLERLLAPTGFLTQIGLYWLEEGEYSIGSAPGNRIRVPATAAANIGTIRVDADGVRLEVNDGVEVLHDDQPVSDILMGTDISENPVLVAHRSLAWSVIDRAGKLAVRIRDFEHPFVETFGPLPYYDIDPGLRVDGVFAPYDEPRTIAVDTVIEGFQQFPVAPGFVVFRLGGQQFELEPTLAGERLFFVFGDETNGDETYGAGRFLYTDLPDDDGRVILDFNRSYSPPCAFNDFSTCPVALPRNRLPVRIQAGEKFDPSLHYSGEAQH
jgi:uncharacterized protein (DUF1684 family)